MTMSELDQISRLLGNIEAKQDTANTQLTLVFQRIDALRKDHSEAMTIVRELKSKLELVENQLDVDVLPTIEEVKKLKQRGIGIITVVGLLCTGTGYVVAKVLKYVNI